MASNELWIVPDAIVWIYPFLLFGLSEIGLNSPCELPVIGEPSEIPETVYAEK